MRPFRRQASWLAVVALALQASTSGYVAACPMKADAAAARACCRAQQADAPMPACHAKAAKASKKACCFLGVMSPCADGAVAEARLTPPTTSVAAAVATLPVAAAWAAPAVPVSTTAPPGCAAHSATGPPRLTPLLI